MTSIFQFFEEIMESYVNRDNVLKDLKKSAAAESPEQVWFPLFVTIFQVI